MRTKLFYNYGETTNMDKDVVIQSQPITTHAQLYYNLTLAVSKGKNEENVLQNILHLEKTYFLQHLCIKQQKAKAHGLFFFFRTSFTAVC